MLFAILASAATYNGSTVTGDGSWNRPIAGGPSISGLGLLNNSSQVFNVGASGLYDFSSVQDYDGYLHVYETSFDPSDQLLNPIARANDDGVGAICSKSSTVRRCRRNECFG